MLETERLRSPAYFYFKRRAVSQSFRYRHVVLIEIFICYFELHKQ